MYNLSRQNCSKLRCFLTAEEKRLDEMLIEKTIQAKQVDRPTALHMLEDEVTRRVNAFKSMFERAVDGK